MWFVSLILSGIAHVVALSTPNIEGVSLQLKRRVRSHTRTNAGVRSITLPATAIARHVPSVY